MTIVTHTLNLPTPPSPDHFWTISISRYTKPEPNKLAVNLCHSFYDNKIWSTTVAFPRPYAEYFGDSFDFLLELISISVHKEYAPHRTEIEQKYFLFHKSHSNHPDREAK